jgi:hypothetical protein
MQLAQALCYAFYFYQSFKRVSTGFSICYCAFTCVHLTNVTQVYENTCAPTLQLVRPEERFARVHEPIIQSHPSQSGC